MAFTTVIKNGVRKFDFFRTSEYFRYRSQPEYKTLFGGIVSLLLIIGLIGTFSNKLIDTVQKVVISAVKTNINAADPTPFTISTYPEDNFMFGVEIWHHDLNTGKRYFDVVLTSVQFHTGETQSSSKNYPLEKCTLDHWQGFPQVQKDYERLKMNYWLCLPRNMKYNIQGKYASEFSQTLQASVNKCTNQSNPERPCASQDQIDDFFKANGPFFFTIYFINPLINPTSEDYLNFYMEDNNYIIFTDKLGSEGILFTEEYKITTDQSIWPFSQNHMDSGGIVTQFALKNPFEIENENYCFFSFYKSGNSQLYHRNFQKLDQVLSYIGGLFGTITICLVFVRIYNQSSFQIRLGASLFQLQNESEEKILKNYNFSRFILTGLYKILLYIGCKPEWKSCKEYDETNEEMAKQLDVLYLLKRVIFLERAVNSLLDEHQLKGIHLEEKLTLEQAKKNRNGFKAKKKLIRLNNKKKQAKNESSPIMTLGQNQNSYERSANIQNLQNMNDQIVQRDYPRQSTKFNIQSRKKLKTIFEKKNSIVFEDESSQIDTDHSDSEQILIELSKLRKQAKKGFIVSKKIWSRFKSGIRTQIQNVIQSDAFTESEKQIEDEQSRQDTQMNLYNGVKPLPAPVKIKFNRRKVSDMPQNEAHLQITNRTGNSVEPNSQFEYKLNEAKVYELKVQSQNAQRHSRIFNND